MPEAESLRRANPYKGPYAFTLKDAALFTGRDEEAETLLSLAISERIVVFCAPSGAGKSSLLNARLIPGLRRRGFKVLPVVRVGGDLLPGVEPANVFTFNALWILAGAKADPASLKDCTLDGFLKPISRGRGRKSPPRVLVFDQFEEILTTHTDRWPQRKDFFLQLRQALLDDPTLSVMLSLREDRLAGLDTYAPLLPGQLRTRFRMETLRRDKAVAAVRQPAQAAGLPFDPEVAERLVEDLSRVRMAGHEDPVPGEFVEPVQLQVVCYQLWENLRDKPRQTITEDDRRAYGDPDQALEGFYESAIRRAAEKTGVPEAQIRHWCGTALITPTRIRSQVNRVPEASGGLPNPAIESLVDSHLVRAEAARGGIWYELAHDRFVDPILRSNQRAAPSEANRLAEDARAWLKANRDPSFLYSGLRLEEALRSSKEAGVLPTPQESEFLAQSQTAEADAQVRRTRRLRFAVGILILLVVAAGSLAWVAWQQRRLAIARELALSATTLADEDPELSLLLALEAIDRARILETEAALHDTLGASTVRKAHSLPVSPNSPGAFAISPDGSQFAAVDLYGNVQVWDVKTGKPVSSGPRPAMFFITSLAWSRTGLVACGDEGGNVFFWKPGSKSPPPPPLATGPGVISLAWSPDGSRLAIAGESPEVRIWNAAANTLETLPAEPGTAILAVAFSQDGRYLAIVPEQASERGEGLLAIRDLQTGERRVLQHPRPVTSVAFGPEGMLATGCQDTGLRIWDWQAGTISHNLFGHRNRISGVAFSPDGKRLATASFDGEARIWSLGSEEPLYTLSPEGGALSKVAFGPHGRILVTVSEAVPQAEQPMGALTLWNVILNDGWTFPAPVRHLAGFTTDSGSLVAVTQGGQALRWDFSNQSHPAPLLDGDSRIARAWMTDKGSLLAIRGQELLRQTVSSLSAVSREPLQSSLNTGIPDPAISLDGRFLASARYKTVSLLGPGATPGTSRIEALPEQEEPVTAMGLSANGDLLAFASGGSIHLWSVAEKDDYILRTSGNWVYDLEITPDGRWLASAESDRTIKLWDLETHELRQTLEGHAGQVIGIAFSPDGRRLASSDEEGQVRLWDLAEGRSIFNIQGSSGAVIDLLFSPDGKWLATLSNRSGTARLKPLAVDELIAHARQRLSGHKLSEREKRIYLHKD